MDEQDFDVTILLEKFAGVGKVDEFYEAVDADDLKKPQSI